LLHAAVFRALAIASLAKSSFNRIMVDQVVTNVESSFRSAFESVFNIDVLLVFAIALLGAYLLSQLLATALVKIAKQIGQYGDTATSPEQTIRMRRLETYMSVFLALLRAVVFAIAIIAAWQYTNPTTTPVALVGASTLFVVLAGATIVPTLRDVTTGSVMIIERWFNVGDFITLEPFANVSGVVERMTLRSTKIRSINGEVIWVHNQHIQAARVASKGVRTLAIDIFVNNLKAGEALFRHASTILPVSSTTLAAALTIRNSQQLSDKLWHITATCQTAPGREWLIEDFAIAAIREQDQQTTKPTIIHGPLVRYADEDAERKFKRAVRVTRILNKETTP
jgi:hypothetical protein